LGNAHRCCVEAAPMKNIDPARIGIKETRHRCAMCGFFME
jgi:hypothetical protein